MHILVFVDVLDNRDLIFFYKMNILVFVDVLDNRDLIVFY